MAAPKKQGLDYFPLDTGLDQDDKLGMIIGEFQSKGELLYIKLLSWTYQHNGYYTEWNEDAQLRFLRRYNYCGFSMSFIQEVVPRLIKWGLFDTAVFNLFHVLTSARIQKTWDEATRKRPGKIINSKFWLIGVNDGNMPEVTELKAVITPQRKLKEIKLKEKKGKDEGETSSPTHPPDLISTKKNGFIAPTLPEVIAFFKEKNSTEARAKEAFTHYELGEWKDSGGKPVKNWRQKLWTNWIKDGEKQPMNGFAKNNTAPVPAVYVSPPVKKREWNEPTPEETARLNAAAVEKKLTELEAYRKGFLKTFDFGSTWLFNELWKRKIIQFTADETAVFKEQATVKFISQPDRVTNKPKPIGYKLTDDDLSRINTDAKEIAFKAWFEKNKEMDLVKEIEERVG